MAGDWIKMDVNLHEKPEVIQLSSALSMDRYAVVGRLHRLWSWFDLHSADGRVAGVTACYLDELAGQPGFSQALRQVGWLEERGGGELVVPNFDRHNGQSAKRRAEATERKRKSRGNQEEPEPEAELGLALDTNAKANANSRTPGRAGGAPHAGGAAGATAGVAAVAPVPAGTKADATLEAAASEWEIELVRREAGETEDGAAAGAANGAGVTASPGRKNLAVPFMSHFLCDQSVTREEKRRIDNERERESARGPAPPSGADGSADEPERGPSLSPDLENEKVVQGSGRGAGAGSCPAPGLVAGGGGSAGDVEGRAAPDGRRDGAREGSGGSPGSGAPPGGAGGGRYPAEFEAFWRAYPKKVGKGAAFGAWKEARGRPGREELLARVAEQRRSRQWRQDEGRFIPLPVTWLNERRWEDAAEVEVAAVDEDGGDVRERPRASRRKSPSPSSSPPPQSSSSYSGSSGGAGPGDGFRRRRPEPPLPTREEIEAALRL